MNDGHWIVNVQYKGGPVEVYGGNSRCHGNTYNSKSIAQEVADELVTYEYGVTEAWPSYVPSEDELLDPNHIGE